MITVAKDGSGDYRTVGEAIASAKGGNNQKTTIYIKNGIYTERLEIKTPFITMIGEDRENTVICYDLYAQLPAVDGLKLGTFRTYSVLIDTHDFTASNITFKNNAGLGKDVGQAIAVYVDGDRIIFDHCNLIASQDTLFTGPLPPKEIEKNGFIGPKQFAPRINGRHFYNGCYIRGDIDFIFGSATAFFENCEIFSQNIHEEINGYVTAASTPEGQEYGYVFDSCRFTSDCPPNSVYLGRPWRNYAKTVIMNSYLGEHICHEGWHNWNKLDAQETCFYGEYGNYGPSALMINRPDWIQRIDEEASKHYIKARVLEGEDGWNPK